MRGRDDKIIITLVTISTLIIFTGWMVWQKKYNWDKISVNLDDITPSKNIINNFTEIKEEIRKAREQWDEAKVYFARELNNQTATQTSSTLNISPEIIEELKKQIDPDAISTTTDNLYEEKTTNQ